MDRWKAIALVLGGILVGTLFAGPGPSMADSHSKFKECVWYGGFSGHPKESKLEKFAEPVPQGWTIAAGAGPNQVLLCR